MTIAWSAIVSTFCGVGWRAEGTKCYICCKKCKDCRKKCCKCSCHDHNKTSHAGHTTAAVEAKKRHENYLYYNRNKKDYGRRHKEYVPVDGFPEPEETGKPGAGPANSKLFHREGKYASAHSSSTNNRFLVKRRPSTAPPLKGIRKHTSTY